MTKKNVIENDLETRWQTKWIMHIKVHELHLVQRQTLLHGKITKSLRQPEIKVESSSSTQVKK